MNEQIEKLSTWCYRGLWGFLTERFYLPDQPPTLPTSHATQLETFKPSEGFLKYMKFKFWVLLLLIDVLIIGGWLIITIVNPIVGAILAVPAFALAIIPDIFAYLAIHLRFDTTWYVMSDRSLRIRRGIWVIHETTITFENIQNVSIRQGPFQRWYGIADVMIETAGGGGSQPGQSSMASHCGLIEGVEHATRIRELLMNRVGSSSTAGLGDDVEQSGDRWTKEHVAALTEISELLKIRLGSAG